jgi:hypothetical protein
MIGQVIIGISIGVFIFVIGFLTFGCLIVNSDDTPLSRKKKIFGFLTCVIFISLGVWVLYRGIIGQELYIKILCGLGPLLSVFGIIMLIFLISLIRPKNDSKTPNLDYGD